MLGEPVFGIARPLPRQRRHLLDRRRPEHAHPDAGDEPLDLRVAAGRDVDAVTGIRPALQVLERGPVGKLIVGKRGELAAHRAAVGGAGEGGDQTGELLTRREPGGEAPRARADRRTGRVGRQLRIVGPGAHDEPGLEALDHGGSALEPEAAQVVLVPVRRDEHVEPAVRVLLDQPSGLREQTCLPCRGVGRAEVEEDVPLVPAVRQRAPVAEADEEAVAEADLVHAHVDARRPRGAAGAGHRYQSSPARMFG